MMKLLPKVLRLRCNGSPLQGSGARKGGVESYESESCKGLLFGFLEAFASIPTDLFPGIQRSARQLLYFDF